MNAEHVPADVGEWHDNPDGIGRFRLLRAHPDGGVTVEAVFGAGARAGLHGHPGGEELLMLEGHARVGGIDLGPGDYLYTPPGCDHRLEAVSSCRMLLVRPAIPTYTR